MDMAAGAAMVVGAGTAIGDTGGMEAGAIAAGGGGVFRSSPRRSSMMAITVATAMAPAAPAIGCAVATTGPAIAAGTRAVTADSRPQAKGTVPRPFFTSSSFLASRYFACLALARAIWHSKATGRYGHSPGNHDRRRHYCKVGPCGPGAKRACRIAKREPRSRPEDALDWLEARLAGAAADAPGERILVASADRAAEPQDLALFLARGLAENRARTLLIDASQGSASLSRRLELARSPGLAELCQEAAGFEAVIRPVPGSSAHFVPSGKPRSLAGGWGSPGMLDKVCRAIDEVYAVSLFCAGVDEAAFLARRLRRPFTAAVMIRSRKARRERRPFRAPLPDFETFGFPLFWLRTDS